MGPTELEAMLSAADALKERNWRGAAYQLIEGLVRHARDVEYDAHPARRIHCEVIFDVGANTGLSVHDFRLWHPHATIYAFEPIAATFDELVRQTSDPKITCVKVALGAVTGDALMIARPHDTMNRIIAPGTKTKAPVEQVPMTTGDAYCAEHGVTAIDFLKIDAEGHDLDVLCGFRRMFDERRVRLVQVEAGMNPENKGHIYFPELLAHMQDRGFRICSFHNQAKERASHVLRRADVVFVMP